MQKQLILTGPIPFWRRGQVRFLIAPSAPAFFGMEWRSTEAKAYPWQKWKSVLYHWQSPDRTGRRQASDEEKTNVAKN
jgi:hypothetical protein